VLRHSVEWTAADSSLNCTLYMEDPERPVMIRHTGSTIRRVGSAVAMLTCIVTASGCMTSAKSAHERQFNDRIAQGEALDDDLAITFGLGRHEPTIVASAGAGQDQ